MRSNFLAQPISILDAQHSLRPLLVSTENLVWFSSSSCQQRLGNLLNSYREMPGTYPKWLELNFLLLAFASIVVNGNWYGLASRKLQTEFGLVRWLRKWSNGLHTAGRSCSTSYGIDCWRLGLELILRSTLWGGLEDRLNDFIQVLLVVTTYAKILWRWSLGSWTRSIRKSLGGSRFVWP